MTDEYYQIYPFKNGKYRISINSKNNDYRKIYEISARDFADIIDLIDTKIAWSIYIHEGSYKR